MPIGRERMAQARQLSSFSLICWYWLPVILYASLIVYVSSLSLLPRDLPLHLENLSDKIWHAAEYAVLGILCYRAFRYASGASIQDKAWPLAIAATVIFGLTDELHQSFVPFRHADGWDLLADAVGAIVAISIWDRIGHPVPVSSIE